MKIRSIRCAGLRGATPEGGWSHELKPDDCVHTLVAVQTDQGLTGIGSVFTSDHLVRGSLKLLDLCSWDASVLMEEPGALAELLRGIKAEGFRAFKIGGGPFGRRNSTLDDAIV